MFLIYPTLHLLPDGFKQELYGVLDPQTRDWTDGCGTQKGTMELNWEPIRCQEPGHNHK